MNWWVDENTHLDPPVQSSQWNLERTRGVVHLHQRNNFLVSKIVSVASNAERLTVQQYSSGARKEFRSGGDSITAIMQIVSLFLEAKTFHSLLDWFCKIDCRLSVMYRTFVFFRFLMTKVMRLFTGKWASYKTWNELASWSWIFFCEQNTQFFDFVPPNVP